MKVTRNLIREYYGIPAGDTVAYHYVNAGFVKCDEESNAKVDKTAFVGDVGAACVVTGYEKTGEDEEKKKVPLHVYDEFRYSEECRNRAATKWSYYKGDSPFSWDNLSADGVHVLSEDGKKAELAAIKEAEKAKATESTKAKK